MWFAAVLALLQGMLTNTASAQNFLGGANGASLTNYSAILVRTAGGALPSLPVQSGFHLTNNSGAFASQTFRVGFRLADAAGGTIISEVFTSTFSFSLFAHSSGSDTRTATLLPALPTTLTPDTPYRVVAQLYRQNSPGNFAAVGFASFSDPYRFQIVNSGSAPGVVGRLTTENVTQSYAVATVPDGDAFLVTVQGAIGRLEQLGLPVASSDYSLYFDATITDGSGADVPLTEPRTTLPVSLANHTAGGGPAGLLIDQTLSLPPAGQLDSTGVFKITVKLLYAGSDGVEHLADTIVLDSQTLLHFNGTLLFGTTVAQINAVPNDAEPVGAEAGTGEDATLSIPDGGASLVANPDHTFGTGDDLNILLHIDGTAEVTSGSVTFTPPDGGDHGAVNGVTFTRDELELDMTGSFSASITVLFPAGFGVTGAPASRRLMASYPAGSLPLDSSLNPIGTANLNPSSADLVSFYAVHEELPELFKSSGIDWDPAAGTFTVHRLDTVNVRASEMSRLNDPSIRSTLDDPAAADHPSNDGYLLHPLPDAGQDVVVTADAGGRAVLTTAQVDLPGNSFTAHFPAGTTITWGGAGALVIQDGLVDTTQSILPGAGDTTFKTSPGAPSNPSPVGMDSFVFTPADGAWTFTPDGGLHAEGTIVPAPLRWGARDAAHFGNQTDNFTAVDAHVPGSVMRGALATTTDDNRAGELLFSGQGQPGDAGYVERPGNAEDYANGFADYAGLNFRVGTDGAQHGTSLIGDAPVGPYELRGTSKYYIRPAGISGIHEAVTSDFAAQAANLVVHGFSLSLNNYQLAFLDNVEADSLITGTVNVPGPLGLAGFAQPFEKLKFTSKNEPSEVILPDPNSFEHTLTYWNAKLQPATVEFQQSPKDGSFALIFGGDLLLRDVLKDPIHGTIGFRSTGRMVAAADGFPGINSRLKPPKLMVLHGTGSSRDASLPGFNVHPVSDIYFNDPDAPGAPGAMELGFVAFAGTVKVPFFQDLKVHVLARANDGSTSIRAGWTDPVTGANFFNNATFDSTNRGFPATATFAQYQDDSEPNDYFDPDHDALHQMRNPYNVTANQSWMDFVEFTMPLTWDPALHRFLSSVPEQRDFLVLNAQRVLKQLTPSGAEIRFGLQFNNIPRLNLAALVVDEKELSNDLIGVIPHGPELVQAKQAFTKLLGNNSDDLLNAAVGTVIDSVIDSFFSRLTDAGALSAQDAVNQLDGMIGVPDDAVNSQLKSSLLGVVGDIGTANTIVNDLNNALVDINSGLSGADELLAKDSMGNRGTFVLSTVDLALKTVGVPATQRDAITDPVNTLINGDLRSTLDDIQDAIKEVHSLSFSAEGLVHDIRDVTQDAMNVATGVAGLPDQVLAAMRESFVNAAKNDPVGQYLSEVNTDKLKTTLKTAAMDAIRQSGFITDLQSTIRDAVEPLHNEYHAAFDQIFGVVNDVVHSALVKVNNEVVDHVNEDLGTLNRAIGDFGDTLQMTQVTGDAHIVGDVLDSATLNANLSMHVGGAVSLRGTLGYSRYHGDQPMPGCAIGGTPDGRMQIKLDAEGNSSIAGCPPVHAKASGQYTMTSGGKPLAVSGAMSVDAGVHFDILSLKNAEFDFAFGRMDNYIYTAAAGSVLIFDAEVKAFMGRTCDPAVLQKVDPDLNAVLTNLGVSVGPDHALNGFYFNGTGDVLLNRLFEIPDDVITLKAHGGQGRFAFVNDAFADLSQFKVIPGMRWEMGVDVGLGPVTVETKLHALSGLDPMKLLQTGDALDIALSMFDPLNGGIHGVIKGNFSASAAGLSKDFDFTAEGQYLPLPPPGTFFVNKLKF